MSIAIALIQLDGLIAGIEANSEIPVQLAELKMLKTLIESDSRSAVTKPVSTVHQLLGTHKYQGHPDQLPPFEVIEENLLTQMFTEPNVIGYTISYAEESGRLQRKPVTAKEFYKDPSEAQPPLRAVPLSLFPSMSSLQAVVDLAYSQLPVTDKNTMHGLLMTYHNSLLETLRAEKKTS